MKDPHLLPSILPNVFAISTSLSPLQFVLQVLLWLKLLFAVKEPLQNMTTVIDNLEGSVIRRSFGARLATYVHARSKISPDFHGCSTLVGSGTCIPGLCKTIDHAEVQGALFPCVAVRPVSTTHPRSHKVVFLARIHQDTDT